MSSDKKARINDQIRASEVRLVDAEGNQLGIVTVEEALSQAKAASLDLVEVSPHASPPVCRIMNYGKFLFGRKKVAKHQRQTQVKEVKLRPVTEKGDFLVKLRHATKFLEHGDKVKVTMRFRGREMLHQEIGRKLIDEMRLALDEIGVVEQHPKLEGRQLVMVIAPKKAGAKKSA